MSSKTRSVKPVHSQPHRSASSQASRGSHSQAPSTAAPHGQSAANRCGGKSGSGEAGESSRETSRAHVSGTEASHRSSSEREAEPGRASSPRDTCRVSDEAREPSGEDTSRDDLVAEVQDWAGQGPTGPDREDGSGEQPGADGTATDAGWHVPEDDPAVEDSPDGDDSPSPPPSTELAARVSSLPQSEQPSWVDEYASKSGPVGRTGEMGGLSDNKARVQSALDEVQATDYERALVTAMGMHETDHMSPEGRDQNKDWDPSRRNYSAFNINGAMLRDIGQGLGMDGLDLEGLNTAEGTGQAAQLLVGGMRNFGTDWLVNYFRGGESAFAGSRAVLGDGRGGTPLDNPWADGKSLKIPEYRAAIQPQTADILQSMGSPDSDNMLYNGKKYNDWVEGV